MNRDLFTLSSLEITAQQERPFYNKYFKQKIPTQSLALIFPGLRYTCDKPLLYYTTQLLLDQERDVIQLWLDYGAPKYKELSQAEQTQYALEYSTALLSAGKNSGSYTEFIIAGKSMGTLMMTLLLTKFPELRQETTIWLTPLVNLPPVSQAISSLIGPAFVASGDADPIFDQGAVSLFKTKSNLTTRVIKNGDHSLEIPGDQLNSLQVLSNIMKDLDSFTNKS
jgi:hypothetical protein